MDVSIIIVNYNTCKMTQECIDSIIEVTKGIDFEIILVDNASTDGSKKVFSNDERIVYIYNDNNIGFGKANNIGIAVAKGRNILFLNSDTLLVKDNNSIKLLSDFLDPYSQIGGCGGNLYTKDMLPSYSYQKISLSICYILNICLSNLITNLLFGSNATFNHTDAPFEVQDILGADLMIKKSILEKVGGFDPRFFMYNEESELCYRIKQAGFKLFSVPQACIIHIAGGSGISMNSLRARYHSLNLYFYITNRGRLYIIVADIIWRMTVLSRIVLYTILCSSKRNLWLKYYAVLKENSFLQFIRHPFKSILSHADYQ